MDLKIIIGFNFYDAGENMNVFLNENWRELLKEMQPYFEGAVETVFASMAQQFFSRIPLNQIFLD